MSDIPIIFSGKDACQKLIASISQYDNPDTRK
jgi:hypothetical protein